MDFNVRKRGIPSPPARREHVEIIELADLEETPSSKRRTKSSRRNSQFLCLAACGATALFGVSTIGILATRPGGLSIPSNVHIPTSRRRLGLLHPSAHNTQDNNNNDAPIHVVTLTDSTRDELYRESVSLRVDTSSLVDLESFLSDCHEIVQSHVSSDIRHALQQLHNASAPHSAVLFHNVPTDPRVPPTPTDSTSLYKTTYVAECMLVGFGSLASGAQVVGYASETQYSNPWIHEGFPRNTPGSALTKASDLSFHQDMSYHSKVPDILGLVSVREGHDRTVKTELVDNRDILELLPPEIIDLLRQDRFLIKTSDWVDVSNIEAASDSSSTSSRSRGRPVLLDGVSLAVPVDWENMVGLDDEASRAVELLQRAILEARTSYVHFVPGDLLFFNNRRAVHARTPYTDLRYDGGDRVLDRVYLRKDLDPEERQSRML